MCIRDSVNGDGHLDLMIGEQRAVGGNTPENPNARLMVLFGDSQGNFVVQEVAVGYGNHESRLADLDADGDLDILGKPFLWDTPVSYTHLDVYKRQAPGGRRSP